MGISGTRSALLAALLLVGTLSLPPSATMSRAHAQGFFQVLATPGGQPDDITVDGRGRLVWGNLSRGKVERLQGGRVVTAARGLSVPEGIVPLPGGALTVAEQGRDRVVRIGPRGRLTVLTQLVPVAGQEGVDGLGLDLRTGAILVPDSPRGTLLSLNPRTRTTRIMARGLGRPVAAALDRYGNILVPDEHRGTVVSVGRRGHVSYRGRFATPDDVAVDRSGRIWVTTLGDNSLWVIAPHAAPRRVASDLLDPQGLTLDRCGDPVVVEQGAGRIVRLLLSAHARSCRF